MILDYAFKSMGPGAALALGLYLFAQRKSNNDKPDVLTMLMTRLDAIESGVSTVNGQVAKVDSEIANVRERVARIEGKLDL